MTATIMKDDNERRQIGPKSPWERLLHQQPAWVQTLVASITYESLEEIVDMIKIVWIPNSGFRWIGQRICNDIWVVNKHTNGIRDG